MNRFRLGVEQLDDRTLPSAVFTSPEAATSASRPLTIELENVLISSYQLATGDSPVVQPGGATAAGKVTFQDFHFTSKVSKSSP